MSKRITNEQPKTKSLANEIFDALTEQQRALVLHLVENQNAKVWGAPGRAQLSLSHTVRKGPRSVDTIRTRVNHGTAADALVVAGWLRFAEMNCEDEPVRGYFWLTEAAGKVITKTGQFPTYRW